MGHGPASIPIESPAEASPEVRGLSPPRRPSARRRPPRRACRGPAFPGPRPSSAASESAVAEERDEGILIRPAAVTPVEMYTPERVAEFLLGSAVDKPSYAKAVAAVREMGLDPTKIDHVKPRRRKAGVKE